MTDLDSRLTRRTLLGAGVLLVAGCRPSRHAAGTDPDDEALSGARAGELALLASYAEGTPDHSAHLAHLRALGGKAPSRATAAPTGTPPVPAAYTDVQTSVAVLQAAAARVRAGGTAAVLASIAASHAVLTAAPS